VGEVDRAVDALRYRPLEQQCGINPAAGGARQREHDSRADRQQDGDRPSPSTRESG